MRKEQKLWGIAGEARAVRRTIDIVMSDNMRFTPDRITVRLGATVRVHCVIPGLDLGLGEDEQVG